MFPKKAKVTYWTTQAAVETMFASGRCKQKATTNWSRSSKPGEVWEASVAIWQTMPTARNKHLHMTFEYPKV